MNGGAVSGVEEQLSGGHILRCGAGGFCRHHTVLLTAYTAFDDQDGITDSGLPYQAAGGKHLQIPLFTPGHYRGTSAADGSHAHIGGGALLLGCPVGGQFSG